MKKTVQLANRYICGISNVFINGRLEEEISIALIFPD